MTVVVILSLCALALLGMPLFIIILAAAMFGFHQADVDLSVIAIECYRLTETPLLVALPFFTFSGYCLSHSQAPQRFVGLIQAVVGSFRSGLAIVALVLCALFTAFTGASGVTIVAIGAVLFPALLYAGYDDRFSLGLVTTSGSLGLLFPPSIPLILYGVIVQQLDLGTHFTMQELFIAGLFPGLLMLLCLALYCLWANRHRTITAEPFNFKRLLDNLRAAIWELPLPVFILVGIYGGYLAISEVAAVTAMYLLIIECVVHREIDLIGLGRVIKQSMLATAAILMILAASLTLANVVIDAEIPMLLLAWLEHHVHHPILFLLLLNLCLLVLGALIDIFSALFLVVPLVLPVALSFGIHPIHLGIIFLTNLQIGYLTPPIGMNLFIASLRFEKSIIEICQAVLPYIMVLLGVLAVITYCPSLSLFTLS